MKARVNNGTAMPIVFNGDNVIILLDPNIKKNDQQIVVNKYNKDGTPVDIVYSENTRLTKPKRRRSKTMWVYKNAIIKQQV